MMRVGLVLERFDPLRGGLEQWTYRFAQGLLTRGHEVHVIAREFAERARRLPVLAHSLGSARTPLALAQAAQTKLESLDLDVIHDMGVGWYADIFHPHGGSRAAMVQRRLLLAPWWLRPLKRRFDPFLPRQRQYRKLMARQYADRGQILVALSRSVADDFRRFHEVSPDRIRIVYNGVDTGHFAPEPCASCRQRIRRQLGIAPDKVLALIVAHNFKLKGVPTLLRAAARLLAEGHPLHVVVVGGKHLGRWQRLARRWGVGDAATFVGPAEDTRSYYAAADLYVHPTFSDTCSLVVLEAAACGLPVITSRWSNGVSELLTDGVEGLLISDPADAEELAARMRTLMDRTLRQKLGHAARRMALQHSFDRNVEDVLSLYEEVVVRRAALGGGPLVWSGRVPAEPQPVEGRVRLRGRQPIRETGVLP